jgi:hypothetical protein
VLLKNGSCRTLNRRVRLIIELSKGNSIGQF